MKIISILSLCLLILLTSCEYKNNSKTISKKDNTQSADTIPVSVNSWSMMQLAISNKEGFKSKFGNKKIRVNNLVVDEIILGDYTVQCLAYSPEDSLLSNTSQKGNPSDRVAEYRDYINEVPCRINPDFTYHFELKFKDPVNTEKLKTKKMIEEKLFKKSYFYSILNVEGESATFKEDVIIMENCKIIER